jgi:hypothetical protein
MQLTDRDVRIMEWAHECRFLTREQVQRLEFRTGAESSCKRRLTLLYHHGYLGRTFLPLGNAYGASRAVYYLDQAGAHCLARLRRRPLSELDWRRRDGRQEEFFLAHALDTNDVRIAFAHVCQARGLELDWLDERALRRLDVLHRTRGRSGEAVTVLPDAYFTITGLNVPDGFALEVDRGTVAERRMRARIRAYGEWAVSGAYRSHLPAESLRVVFAVTDGARDPRRLTHLKRWCEEEGGRSLFWFVDRNGLQEDVLASPVWWVAGDDEKRRLALGSDRL